MEKKGGSAPLLEGFGVNYGTATLPQIQTSKAKTATATTDILGWAGRGILGVGSVGFVIAASGVVGWPVAAVALGLMVVGAGLCITSEVKKECSRTATTFGANPVANASTVAVPVAAA